MDANLIYTHCWKCDHEISSASDNRKLCYFQGFAILPVDNEGLVNMGLILLTNHKNLPQTGSKMSPEIELF